MEINIKNDTEKLVKIGKSLSHPVRIKLLQILHDKEMTLKEIHELMPEIKYKDNIFRHLETLKNSGFVQQFYNDKKKKLVYKVKADTFIVNL